MVTTRRVRLILAMLTYLAAFPPPAHARAEPGTELENVELRTLAGGKERLLSQKVKANVFVFFRPNHERSLDALRQLATCEQELAAKPVRWAAVVSGSEEVAEVKAFVAQAGIRMPVLVDEGDVLYARLGIRLHPIVGIADGSLKLVALEPYRQLEYCEVVKMRIRMLLGEAGQAQLDEVTDPERSPLPGADPMKKAMRDVNMARRLLEIGQYKDSIKFAQRALLVAPVAAAYTVMGKAHAKNGKCAEATKAFEAAMKLDPADAEAAAGRASCARK
jgi:tetratricopeptide (TPR) repeat protein